MVFNRRERLCVVQLGLTKGGRRRDALEWIVVRENSTVALLDASAERKKKEGMLVFSLSPLAFRRMYA